MSLQSWTWRTWTGRRFVLLEPLSQTLSLWLLSPPSPQTCLIKGELLIRAQKQHPRWWHLHYICNALIKMSKHFISAGQNQTSRWNRVRGDQWIIRWVHGLYSSRFFFSTAVSLDILYLWIFSSFLIMHHSCVYVIFWGKFQGMFPLNYLQMKLSGITFMQRDNQ